MRASMQVLHSQPMNKNTIMNFFAVKTLHCQMLILRSVHQLMLQDNTDMGLLYHHLPPNFLLVLRDGQAELTWLYTEILFTHKQFILA